MSARTLVKRLIQGITSQHRTHYYRDFGQREDCHLLATHPQLDMRLLMLNIAELQLQFLQSTKMQLWKLHFRLLREGVINL